MFRRLLIILLVLLAAVSAGAAETRESFAGYFDKMVFLRPDPAASSVSLASIPAGTPVELRPVDDRYAEVTYQGRTGYVYYAGVKQCRRWRRWRRTWPTCRRTSTCLRCRWTTRLR